MLKKLTAEELAKLGLPEQGVFVQTVDTKSSLPFLKPDTALLADYGVPCLANDLAVILTKTGSMIGYLLGHKLHKASIELCTRSHNVIAVDQHDITAVGFVRAIIYP